MEINRTEILELYKGLRVTDVIDGMDAVGLQDTGTMIPDIHPLWRDIENFKHCFMGFAMTVRFMPTNNAYDHMLNGFTGIVTNGTCRDSDELIKQQVPIHFRIHGRGIRPGRLEYDTCNVPVNVDGVVVVPIEHVYEVGQFARSVAEDDKASRRKLFEKAGREFDFTCF